MAQSPVLGANWTLQHASPTGENLRSIAVNGSVSLVAVGGHGTILTSDGVGTTHAWVLNSLPGITADLWDVKDTGSQYVAVGSSSTILTASDTLTTPSAGLTWTKVTSATFVSTDQFNAVSVNSGLWVAVGATSAGGGVAVVSNNSGTTWARYPIASTTSLKDLTIVPGTGGAATIYAVMDGYLLSSSNNGASWSRTSLSGTTVTSLAYATPSTGGTPVLTITGSTSWTKVGTGSLQATNAAPADLHTQWVGNELVGVTRSGQLWQSSDGLSWQKLDSTQTTPFNKATNFNGSINGSGTYVNTTYVAVGLGGIIQTYTVGGSWTSLTATGTTTFPANGVAWNQIAATPGSLYVAVGSGISWTSANGGVTWVEHLQPGLTMLSIVWTGNNFVAIGNGLWVSSDGITWTSQQTPPRPDPAASTSITTSTGTTTVPGPSVYAVAWFGSIGYALGYDAISHQVMLSASNPLGFAWSTFKPVTGFSGTQWAMLGLTSGNGLYVAVGWGGHVLVSTAPQVGWTQHIVTLATGEDFTDVVWANSQFTAVTNKGGIWTSPTGSTWTKRKTASQALWCITRVTHNSTSVDDQFIAAGDHGVLVTSFLGQEWVEASLGSSQFTNQILWAPAGTTDATPVDQLVTASGFGAFYTSQGTPPVQPNVSFSAISSSVAAWGGTDAVTVQLSASNPLPVTATFAFAGSALSTNYKRSGSSVTFAPGETTKTLTITGVNDSLKNDNATVVITLTKLTGDVKLGATTTHTVTITDTIQGTNPSPFVTVGTAVTLTSSATPATTTSWQWLKNDVTISGATQPYYLIPSAALTDAATYTLQGRNTTGTGQSNSVPLTVLDGSNQTFTTAAGNYPTLTVLVKGPDLTKLSYQWSRTTIPAGTPPPAPVTTVLTGETHSTLTLTSSDAISGDTYTCLVTYSPSGTPSPSDPVLSTGTYTFLNVTSQSVLTQPNFTSGQVGQAYSFALAPLASNNASLWIVSGLPSGLGYNSTTGLISGTPTRAGTFKVTVQAANADNATRSTASAPLTISALKAGALGTYMALVGDNSAVSLTLRGRLDLTTSSAGTFTGKLTNSTGVFPFTGILGGTDATVRTGNVHLPAETIAFTVDGGTGAVGGTVTLAADLTTAPINGWRQTATNSSRTGYYSFALSPTDSSGSGYGFLTVAAAGTVNIATVVPAGLGAKAASSSIMGPNGEIGLYVPLPAVTYTNLGSALGQLTLSADTASNYQNNAFTGNVYVTQQNVTPATVTLGADGGRYAAPAKGKIVMNLVAGTANASLSFTSNGPTALSPDPSTLFTIKSDATASDAGSNPDLPSLRFTTASTGEFQGGFNQPSGSVGSYYGALIRPSGSEVMTGKGFFFLGSQFGSVSLTHHP